jgi:hypothetical protein
MKNVRFSWLFIMAVLLVAAVSCEKDKKTSKKLSEDILNIVPDSTLDKIMDLGMTINKGLEPPLLENSYLASPFILKGSNIPSDYVGYEFSDYYFTLYDQDDDELSIKLDYSNGGETGTGLGGFMSGSGNKFSVFVEVDSEYNGYPARLIHIISGTMTEEGIKDLYFANFMLDNYGNEGGYWIENEQGRVIYDSDGMSEIIDDFKSARGGTGIAGSAARLLK